MTYKFIPYELYIMLLANENYYFLEINNFQFNYKSLLNIY